MILRKWFTIIKYTNLNSKYFSKRSCNISWHGQFRFPRHDKPVAIQTLTWCQSWKILFEWFSRMETSSMRDPIHRRSSWLNAQIAHRNRSKNIYEKHKLAAPFELEVSILFYFLFFCIFFYMDFNEEKLISVLSSAHGACGKQSENEKQKTIIEWLTGVRDIRCRIELDHRRSY